MTKFKVNLSILDWVNVTLNELQAGQSMISVSPSYIQKLRGDATLMLHFIDIGHNNKHFLIRKDAITFMEFETFDIKQDLSILLMYFKSGAFIKYIMPTGSASLIFDSISAHMNAQEF